MADHRLCEKFFENELDSRPRIQSQKRCPVPTTLDEKFNRIDARLRRVLTKACENSYAASRIVDKFEGFLLGIFSEKVKIPPGIKWEGLLLKDPSVTLPMASGSPSVTSKFCFDAELSSSGFNRLLLHGLCQYHGLSAASSTVVLPISGRFVSARVLSASGSLSGPKSSLTVHIVSRQRMNANN